MKTLVTKRLILRDLRPTDLIPFHNYSVKSNIGPRAGWAPHQSLEFSMKILRVMISENEVWAITFKDVDEIIGTIGLHMRDFFNALENQREIGYVIDDRFWGQGLVPEAVDKVLEYGFMDFNLSAILCGHYDFNVQSKRVIEKTGFTYTHDEIRDYYDGTQIGVKMYKMTKEEYLERRIKNDNTR